jgi:hypothetical protein
MLTSSSNVPLLSELLSSMAAAEEVEKAAAAETGFHMMVGCVVVFLLFWRESELVGNGNGYFFIYGRIFSRM